MGKHALPSSLTTKAMSRFGNWMVLCFMPDILGRIWLTHVFTCETISDTCRTLAWPRSCLCNSCTKIKHLSPGFPHSPRFGSYGRAATLAPNLLPAAPTSAIGCWKQLKTGQVLGEAIWIWNLRSSHSSMVNLQPSCRHFPKGGHRLRSWKGHLTIHSSSWFQKYTLPDGDLTSNQPKHFQSVEEKLSGAFRVWPPTWGILQHLLLALPTAKSQGLNSFDNFLTGSELSPWPSSGSIISSFWS